MDQKPSNESGRPPVNVTGNQFWNARYQAAEYAYGKAPNAFFAESLAALTPGKLLLPAEGEGRNAVYAASQGWEVDAIDFSEAGREKALALSAAQGVQITYELADLMEFSTEKSYDLIAFIFVHMPPQLGRAMYRRYLPFLKSGGKIVMEVFHPQQLGLPSGGPKSLDWLIDEAELAETFSELIIEQLESGETTLAEGAFHDGPAFTTRLIAQKK
jgi:SAM-dependent methyltransferase